MSLSLLEAVHRVNVPRVAALLCRGADVNITDAQGVTPLIIACERGELRMVDLLLEAKASTKMATNETQSSCLHIAAKNNAAGIVRRLLRVDPAIEERATSQGDTALMVACLSAVETEASAATITALLQPPSDKTSSSSKSSRKYPLGPDDPRLLSRNRHGHTALHCAAFAQSPTAVRMLLEAGADCTVGDKAGRTAVEVALNLEGKKTALREGARGGSAPAAECVRLLKQRWAELESEAKERERVLLGELEKGASSLLGAVKGRGVGAGNGLAGATSGKKNARKKKKQRQQSNPAGDAAATATAAAAVVTNQSERAAGDAGGEVTTVPPLVVGADADDGGDAALKEASQRKGGIDAAEGAEAGVGEGLGAAAQAAAAAVSSTSDDAGGSADGATEGCKQYNSDSEGETDDEAGSHPSSEAETGSHEDPQDRVVVTAAVVAALAQAEAVETVEAATAAATVTATEAAAAAAAPAAASKNRDALNAGGGQVGEGGEAEAGGGNGGGGSWEVVARPTRRKKATPPLPLLPRSSPPPGRGGSPHARAQGGPHGVGSAPNRSGDFPALPRRRGVFAGGRNGGYRGGADRTSPNVAQGYAGQGSAASRAPVAVAPSVAPAAAATTAPLPLPPRVPGSEMTIPVAAPVAATVTTPATAPALPLAPPAPQVAVSSVTPVVSAACTAAAAAMAPSYDGALGAATAPPPPPPPPCDGTPGKISSPPPPPSPLLSTSPAVPPQAVEASNARAESGGGGSSGSSSDGGGGSEKRSNAQRQLNAKAHAWVPTEAQPSPPPPPPPPAPPVQQMPMQQQRMQHIPMQPMHPRPPMAGVQMGAGHGLRHAPQQQQQPHPQQLHSQQQQHPQQQQQQHQRQQQHPQQQQQQQQPLVWGGPQASPAYNSGRGSGVNGAPVAVNFGHNGFAGPSQVPPMMAHPGPGMNCGPRGVMPPPPPPPPPPRPVMQHVSVGMMPGGVAGGGDSPAAPAPSGRYSLQDVRSGGGAQGLLEASSSEAAALALRVEHLVWGMEVLSAQLSMGQLDALKTVLLDQVAKVDEAKLEQVRVQERSKNEEKASILHQLHQFQADEKPAAAVVVDGTGGGGGGGSSGGDGDGDGGSGGGGGGGSGSGGGSDGSGEEKLAAVAKAEDPTLAKPSAVDGEEEEGKGGGGGRVIQKGEEKKERC